LHEDALAFATAAAKSFGVKESETGSFNSDIANKVLKLDKSERTKLLRQGPVTEEAIEQLGKQSKSKAKKEST
jgi:hypothetical protein